MEIAARVRPLWELTHFVRLNMVKIIRCAAYIFIFPKPRFI